MATLGPRNFKTIEDVKKVYGQKAEEKRLEMERTEDLIEHLHKWVKIGMEMND
jgi:hypothetical protein